MSATTTRTTARLQRGAGLVETIVVLPTMLLVVTCIWQAALVYRAKASVNYAALEAARAGSVGNASIGSINAAFQKALLPYYGGGRNYDELADTAARVANDFANAAVRIEIISPTQESFTDYASPAARAVLNDENERRARKSGTHATRITEPVIPNVGLDELTCPRDVPGCKKDPKRNASGQSLLDANLLKLRITYGIGPTKQMPLAGRLYTWALDKLGTGTGDAFVQGLLKAGRIPVTVHTTVRMQSDAIRNTAMISSPGPGNDGNPVDPGPAPGNGNGPGPGSGSGSDPTSPTLPTCPYWDPTCLSCPNGIDDPACSPAACSGA